MKLLRHKFEHWLKSKKPMDIVGKNRDCHSCPIGLFYRDASGGSEVVIFDDQRGRRVIDRGYDCRVLPQWAADFVFTVDGEANGNISAARALEILERS